MVDTQAENESAELRRLLQLHDVALGTMSHGLCMFDAQDRLVLFNERFIAMYGMSPDVIRCGASLEDVFMHGAESLRLTPEQTEEAWRIRREQLAAGQPFVGRHRFQDGRVMSYSFRPMPGGGWIAVYEDVTKQQRMQLELRTQVDRLHQALRHLPHAISMFDKDERLIVCNRQYIELYGHDADIVVPGVTHRDIIENWIAQGNGSPDAAEEVYRSRMDAVATRRPTCWLNQSTGKVIEAISNRTSGGGWITVSEDITARLEAESALREQNIRFDTALEHMAQGLLMLDADLHVLVCNHRFLEMYGLDPALVQPGASVLDVIRHGVSVGNHGSASVVRVYETFLEFLYGDEERLQLRQTKNDRMFALRKERMPNGGWVVTYADVTETERASEALREQNLRFDAALNNMSHGLCMFDREHRLTVFNKQYIEIFRLAPESVKPGISLHEMLQLCAASDNYSNLTADDLHAEYMERIKAGSVTFLRHLADGRVINISCRSMQNGGWVATHEDITERYKSEERIAFMARHDSLTGLPNRVLFKEKMAEGLARAESEAQSMAVICLDLDNFKTVNDTLGHPIGDRLLTIVAQRLVCMLGEETTIARLGGDEFAILQAGPQPAAAEALATSILDVLSQPVVIDEHELISGVSVGIAIAPNDGVLADHLMKCADLALYRAKADGRGKFRFFEPDMDARLQAKRALEQDLRKSLHSAEFSLVYQPQVRAQTGELTGFEALLRWNHPTRGSVSPAEFIPIAEETGLIVALGEWVLRNACAAAAKWPRNLRIAVNLSPVQFKSRGLVSMVTQALATAGLSADRLELEITEAVLLQDEGGTRAALHQLRALGIRISMDDFGTGYSSLSYLRSFPFDKIKIDRSFVHDIDRKPDGLAIIRAMTSLAASLGIETMAEGVETAEQMELIRREGCGEVQGFLISRPLTAEDADGFIARSIEHKAVA